MPIDTSLKKILVIGSGPIVIGQACEFDYSGVQACKVLREEGLQSVLVNSNPATVMTDPEYATATYIEPLTVPVLTQIIAQEQPDALLPIMGGQTALNCTLTLAHAGVLEQYAVRLIGASVATIEKAEDRFKFQALLAEAGLKTPYFVKANNLNEALLAKQTISFPIVVRTSYTLAGTGGGIAYNEKQFIDLCRRSFDVSSSPILIEQSVLGWKEFELELMADAQNNHIVVCAIENIDGMGIHTGDSMTVAPAQTLTDKEYQRMREAAFEVMRCVGMTSGGCNVQFAVNPENGELLVIEINPRVSRSSALASKATGYPIAKIATKIALGYSLDELKNEISGNVIPAAYEPTLDYIVVKLPRFDFEKFPDAETNLTTQMKSVGEVMAVGEYFTAALLKAIDSLEDRADSFYDQLTDAGDINTIKHHLREPTPKRLYYLFAALRKGLTVAAVAKLSRIDAWFINNIAYIIKLEMMIKATAFADLPWRILKRSGFSDRYLAKLLTIPEHDVLQSRLQHSIRASYRRVDGTAAEVAAKFDYLYSSYQEFGEVEPMSGEKILIVGSGANRIGQGIEFDYCCVHAAEAVRASGRQVIILNSNPETVSTDYDTSDRLYFEPVTIESVLAICDFEKPSGVILQTGGQTALNMLSAVDNAGFDILGTTPTAIDRVENRACFRDLLDQLGLRQPENKAVDNYSAAAAFVAQVGFPVILRPSYVIGGGAIKIIVTDAQLQTYFSGKRFNGSVLIERMLNAAIEVEVDAVADGKRIMIAGIMQQFEPAGIHSGDSYCSVPPYSLSPDIQQQLVDIVETIAFALPIIGFINVQFALVDNTVFVIEVNPRAARTIPFLSKAIGLPFAKLATKAMLGEELPVESAMRKLPSMRGFAVKGPVFPYAKLQGAEKQLGPEMHSIGEVMGFGDNIASAKASCLAAIAKADRSPQPFLVGDMPAMLTSLQAKHSA